MGMQSIGGNSIPSSNTTDGKHVAVPTPSASLPRPVVEHKPVADTKSNSVNLQRAVENINQSLKQRETNVEFSIDKDTKMNVVKMLDSDTGEVIRQYPSEVTLAIAKAIDQGIKQGALLNQKA